MLYMDNPLPAKVHLVGHAFREIGNRFPEIILGSSTGGHLQYKQRVDTIVVAMEKHGLPTDGNLPASSVGEPDAESPGSDVCVPQELYLAFAVLIRDHNSVPKTNLDRAARMYSELDGSQKTRDDPAVKAWNELREWFVGITHVTLQRRQIDEQELRSRVDRFEAVLSSMIGSFYGTMDDIDDLLDEANS